MNWIIRALLIGFVIGVLYLAMSGRLYHGTLRNVTGYTAAIHGRLWYAGMNAVANAIGYAQHYSRSHHAVIRVYDDAGNVTETHEHKGNNLPDGAAPGGFQASIRQMLPTS